MMRLRLWPFRRKGEMDCPEVRKMAAYLTEQDPEAHESVIDRLKRHLSWCVPCAAFVRTLQATVDLVRGIPPQSPPEGLEERLRKISHGEADE